MNLFRRLMMPDGTGTGGGNAGATGNREGAGAAAAAGAASGGAPGAAAGANGGNGATGGAAAAGGAAGAGAGAGGASGAAAAGAGTGAAGAAGAAGAGGAAGGTATDDPAARWTATRTGWAKEDQAKQNWLGRYVSVEAALDAAWNAQQRLAQTRSTAPPENATAEQLTAWRKDNGIPEKADGYWDAVKELKIEEGDKEIIAPYLPVMHELNLTPAQAQKLITFRQSEMERQIDERHQADVTLRGQVEEELRGEWGSNYKANTNGIKAFLLANFGEEGMDQVMNARTPDGDPLLGKVGVLRALVQLSHSANGGPVTITTASGTTIADLKGATARKAELVKLMGDEGSVYWKGPEAAKLQQEFRDIVDYEERQKARAA